MNVDEMSSFLCELCGSSNTRFAFFVKDKNRRVDNAEYKVMRCEECGVGFTLPKLSAQELSRYYTNEYYSLDGNMKLEAATRPHNQTRVEKIRRFVREGKLLDVGAGTGMFLKTAKENGFDAEGLEISADAAAFGNATWGLNIRQGNLHETSLPPECYDVVTLGHVLEHLHKPHDAISRLHSILKRDGLLVVAVPNFASMQAALFGSHWFHLDVPRHLFHYTPANINALVEGKGFTVVGINYFSAEHNWAGFLGSVMKLSRPGETFPHKFARKVFGVPVERALSYGESALKRGGTFEVYAIKQ